MESVAESIKKIAEGLEPDHFNPVIMFRTKSNYGGPELVYVTSHHGPALQQLTGMKTLTTRHVEALKALGFIFHQQSGERKQLASEYIYSVKQIEARIVDVLEGSPKPLDYEELKAKVFEGGSSLNAIQDFKKLLVELANGDDPKISHDLRTDMYSKPTD